jgi:hypothetical protein
LGDLAHHGRHHGSNSGGLRAKMEIAIMASLAAKGNVEVEAGHGGT